MQESLSQGTIGRVMVDRNTAFHFLDKSGLKRNRQIRMIRYIDYPMEYYLAHVSHDVMASSNDTNDSDDEVLARRTELSVCGKSLKELSADLFAVAKDIAEKQLIPAELQVVNCFLWIFYSSPRTILLFMFSIYFDAISSLKIICFFSDSGFVRWNGRVILHRLTKDQIYIISLIGNTHLPNDHRQTLGGLHQL